MERKTWLRPELRRWIVSFTEQPIAQRMVCARFSPVENALANATSTAFFTFHCALNPALKDGLQDLAFDGGQGLDL